MEKPALLRAEIEKHLPELAANPEKLTMFVTGGRILAGKGALSHESAYTLNILINDFVGDIDVINAIVIKWLSEYQADALGPGYTDPKGYSFEVDILNDMSADILIELRLTERTTVLVDDDGNVSIAHPKNAGYKDVLGIIGKMDAGG